MPESKELFAGLPLGWYLFRFFGINVDTELEKSFCEEARLPAPPQRKCPGGRGGDNRPWGPFRGENRPQVDKNRMKMDPLEVIYIPAPLPNKL